MSNHNFPRVHKFIANLCASNEDLLKLFNDFEHALEIQEKLCVVRHQAPKDRQNLELDLMLLRQAHSVNQQMREQLNGVDNTLMESYEQLLELGHLMNDDRIKNMMRFGVLRKQIEVQDKLNRIEAQQVAVMQCKTAMESRTVVQEFRKWQRALKAAQERYARIQLEAEECNSQWRIKIDRVTKLRNQKIVALLQIRKQLMELEAPPQLQLQRQRQRIEKAITPQKPLSLQSAIDFLENFSIAETKIKSENEDKNKDAAPLQSILVINRPGQYAANESKLTKQVQFAPLPLPLHLDVPSDFEVPEDTSEPESESEHELLLKISTKDLPERPIIEKVEVLPPLQLSMEFQQTASDQNLCFKNIFPSNTTMDDDDNSDNKKDEYESNSNSDSNGDGDMTSTIMQTNDDNDQISSQNNDKVDANDLVVDNNNSMDFAGPTRSNKNEDFFLFQFDDNSREEQQNNHSTYEL